MTTIEIEFLDISKGTSKSVYTVPEHSLFLYLNIYITGIEYKFYITPEYSMFETKCLFLQSDYHCCDKILTYTSSTIKKHEGEIDDEDVLEECTRCTIHMKNGQILHCKDDDDLE